MRSCRPIRTAHRPNCRPRVMSNRGPGGRFSRVGWLPVRTFVRLFVRWFVCPPGGCLSATTCLFVYRSVGCLDNCLVCVFVCSVWSLLVVLIVVVCAVVPVVVVTVSVAQPRISHQSSHWSFKEAPDFKPSVPGSPNWPSPPASNRLLTDGTSLTTCLCFNYRYLCINVSALHSQFVS